jgi:hypothetical protein
MVERYFSQTAESIRGLKCKPAGKTTPQAAVFGSWGKTIRIMLTLLGVGVAPNTPSVSWELAAAVSERIRDLAVNLASEQEAASIGIILRFGFRV